MNFLAEYEPFFPTWAPGQHYAAGTVVIHGAFFWTCDRDHTSGDGFGVDCFYGAVVWTPELDPPHMSAHEKMRRIAAMAAAGGAS